MMNCRKLYQPQLESLNPAHDQLGVFIRILVGLDREALSQFLQNTTFTAKHLHFINLIIDHLTQNGIMDPAQLYEAPYNDLSSNGLDGVLGMARRGRLSGF
jgi:type I restriction enzyme R subunit